MASMCSAFNKMKRYHSYSLLLAGLLFINACKKDHTGETYAPTQYSFTIPHGFPQPAVDTRTITNEGVRLGRMLYYDPILSSNGRSCSSCHNQEYAFSLPVFNHLSGDVTSVPGHINLAWKSSFLWEGAKPSIEEVCMEDFEPEFFNTDMNVLADRLLNHPDYPRLFDEAFNIKDVSDLTQHELKVKITTAIAQFINTITSSDSKYDRYKAMTDVLTQEELRGLIIFSTEEGDCFHCHVPGLFTDNNLHNTGLDEFPSGRNLGNFVFSGDSNQIGKFSTPTLRNIEYTGPYMHDGRFQTIEDVIEFYNSGVHQNSPNLDPIMTKPNKINGLNLTPYDKQCLAAFLRALSDTSFISNPTYGSPF
jgi:cytochrome c peroxidase